ncbi:MAG: toxin-antitoxin (TA) system antitoxin [Anaerolineales bacterium]|nr:toxin-antitoxin (TA) system antitoxin [Anaerolineales bacterium]
METKTVDIKKENTPLKKLVEFVASGMDVLLLEGKVPVARLVSVGRKAGTRVRGLHGGKVWMSDDFDAPLPDSFWLGESGA